MNRTVVMCGMVVAVSDRTVFTGRGILGEAAMQGDPARFRTRSNPGGNRRRPRKSNRLNKERGDE